jgi:hypothetical protein
MFPSISGQSGFNKRLRSAGPLIVTAITALARDTRSWYEVLRLGTQPPLPCGTSRETAKRYDLAGHAGYGYYASRSRFFWGFGERKITGALLPQDRHLIGAGQVALGYKGFVGRDFERFVTNNFGAHLIRPNCRDQKPRTANSVASANGSNLCLRHHQRPTCPGTTRRTEHRRGLRQSRSQTVRPRRSDRHRRNNAPENEH